ncbi:hypothetical protein H6786_03160 [Candidatus Nomurabacteria bacterium]|nr:hypothetical protein [Candidatus Nomurabacteria bacterium]
MNISIALHEGLVDGIPEKPERFVETVMSDVFIYPTVVRKVYKDNRKGFFTDLRDLEVRRQYYAEDFAWNQGASKDIHLGLRGVQQTEAGAYEIIAAELADEWFIEMKRVRDDDTLFRRLNEGTTTREDVAALAKAQTEALDALTEEYLHTFEDLLARGLRDLWHARLDGDLRMFGKNFSDQIAPELTDHRVDTLLNFFHTHDYFTNMDPDMASVAIDNHAGNVVFHEERPQFIDIHLAKRDWRVIDRNNNIARIATCVRVLGNNELADAMYEAYQDHHELAPAEVTAFQEAYNAFIKGYYYTYLKQPDIAKKYFTFADATLAEL